MDQTPPDRPRRVPLAADEYDARWTTLAAAGADVHGEASLVDGLLAGRPSRVLDAGCGTGRVAVELTRRGHRTVGVDVDPDLLAHAREKAPTLDWVEGDLARLPADVAPGPFDAAVLAGNVMIFVARGTEGAVIANLAARLAPGGFVVAGFQLSGRLALAEYDDHARGAGLELLERWTTWDRAPWSGSGDYAVSVHTLGANR